MQSDSVMQDLRARLHNAMDIIATFRKLHADQRAIIELQDREIIRMRARQDAMTIEAAEEAADAVNRHVKSATDFGELIG